MTNPAFSFTHSVNIGSLHKQHKITITNNCLSLTGIITCLPEKEKSHQKNNIVNALNAPVD